MVNFCAQLKKLVEKPVEPVPNVIENGDGGDDEGNEWQVRISEQKMSLSKKLIENAINKPFQLIDKRNKGTVTRSTDFGRTPLSDIFRGELRSRLQREGDHSTDVMQPFFTLQLNIEVTTMITTSFSIK